jgi:Predicted acyltransferases
MGEKEQTLKIQKTEWIHNQIQKQREAEDALFEQIRQEQEVLDRLSQSITEKMEQTKEARKYNQEFQERMDAQVYALHGITEDKLQGISEYRNAYFRGCAFSLFLLSVVLVVLCGFLHGFQSQICLFMLAFTGMEGTLLAQSQSRGKILNIICNALYLLIFPLMMVVFICFELGYQEYHMILPWLAIFGICILIVGTAAYFFYNPYRKERRSIGAAKDTIREIEKTARKEVRKNKKSREKSAKKQQKLLVREASRQRKFLEKEEKRQRRLSEKSGVQQKLLEKKEMFLERFHKEEKAENAGIEAVEDVSQTESEGIEENALEEELIEQKKEEKTSEKNAP